MKSILTLAVMSAFALSACATNPAPKHCCNGKCKTSCCKAAAKDNKKCCGDKCACACCAKKEAAK